MSIVPLSTFTIQRFRDGLREKKFTAVEITQAFFSHIKDTDKKIGAYLSLNEEGAVKAAEEVDLARERGEPLSDLAGVPLAVKDNILIEGLPATAASRTLESYRAAYDATAIAKLKGERAIFLGKTNLDEFGMGASTENSAFQITRNPYDPTRVPGGSSGGSAAAVATHMALAALGTDTGGSVRQPASFCGVVGLKPTYGAVSRFGIIALASSLDQIGPIAKTVADAETLFAAIRGHDLRDATSQPERETSEPEFKEIKELTIGLPKECFSYKLEPEVEQALERAIADFKSLGIAFKEISLPHLKYGVSAYYIILTAEASANLARYDGIRYSRTQTNPSTSSGYTRTDADTFRQETSLLNVYLKHRAMFGSEVKRRIILGTFVLSSGYYDAYYKKAQQARSLIKRDFGEAFKTVDLLLAPTSPTAAFRIGEKTADPLAMYLSDIFTLPVNLAGLPAISIPVRPRMDADQPFDGLKVGADGRGGISENQRSNPRESASLPVGFQLIGKAFDERTLFAVGKTYEAIHGIA